MVALGGGAVYYERVNPVPAYHELEGERLVAKDAHVGVQQRREVVRDL